MKTIGTVLCLFALSSTEGRQPSSALSLSATLTGTYREASAARKRSDYEAAAALFEFGRNEARRRQEPEFEARFLWGLGNCHFAQRRYQEALTEYLEARDGFSSLGERGFVRALNGNIGSLYSQLGELDSAVDAMKRAIDGDPALESTASGTRRMVTLATLLAQTGSSGEAIHVFRQAIEAAARLGDAELLSNALDRLGGELLSRKELAAAEEALLEAFRIRKLQQLPSLAGSYGKLGLLRLAQGDRRSASALLDAAIEESRSSRARIPEWRFYDARGRLRLSEDRLAEAYADFRLALELARNYRLTAPASDATRISVEAMLQPLYAAFAETGSRLYFETGQRRLASETFQALEENRGGSLAQRLHDRPQLRRMAPPAYWEALSALQSAETAALLEDTGAARERMRGLRAEIVEMEARAGGANFEAPADSLQQLRRRLGSDAVLLSFHLGAEGSSLWAVSASDLSLYRLPDRAAVVAAVQRFGDAIRNRRDGSERLGRQLYDTLFGQLAPGYRNKTRWLLSLDEGLFETPFGALMTSGGYLAERHSLRIVSGASHLLASSKRDWAGGRFAGIGDAIYNTADERWRPGAATTAAFGLTRLPGSGPEIEACGRQWRGGSALLEGAAVTRANVRRMVEGGASVVHFATHVLADPQRSNEALISLGLGGGGEEMLGAAEIGGWSVTAPLVVLSGCNSGGGAARPGAGLMGMTRAWLMAGAGAVVATSWPVSDEPGAFFRVFYRELQRDDSQDPAEALRAAQIEAIRAGGWRSRPDYWAAYFTVGNY